ncbi:SagB/ThcOx family dehydrogenase [Mesorhizobium sp. M1A.F.Ca.IN.022.06.1.1]|uniref:SagB/ThcOx family dehydrogenase n=1 Tax=Mesorhizobium sp. M1A.F.Ca.IN.022.06.1.1 TaxID=2493680 RepID=UPI000F75E016|nr:SagB/ThcOx family dehydrogenase [Mesorhizobium sp. M1A.F.Ca.IN.022.06.1.1]AZO59680.1 SagB/ThcOx family dehydrogenase [Mesorhizobium sp. M1A.F.Ca.IN.022.06.1.1]
MTKRSLALEWKPVLTIRPNFVGKRGEVQISDALGQQRYKVRKRDLLDALCGDHPRTDHVLTSLKETGLLAKSWDPVETGSEGVEHWTSRNWTFALSYYLWSRRSMFLDEGEDYERIRCTALRDMLDESNLPLPEPIKEEEAIQLPEAADLPENESVGEVLANRVTTLAFSSGGKTDAALLHGLLFHGFSVSRPYHVPNVEDHIHNILHGVGFAFDPFLAIFDINGIEPGLYDYNISQDRLKLVKKGVFRKQISSGLIGHEQALTAACTVLLVADFRRFQWRYRHERALRNLYFDVGRMAQYFILVSTAFGLKTHITPATVDDDLAKLLDIDPDERQVFHSITLGF